MTPIDSKAGELRCFLSLVKRARVMGMHADGAPIHQKSPCLKVAAFNRYAFSNIAMAETMTNLTASVTAIFIVVLWVLASYALISNQISDQAFIFVMLVIAPSGLFLAWMQWRTRR